MVKIGLLWLEPYLYLPGVELTVFGSLQVSHYNRCYNHTELQIITVWLQDDFLDLLNTFCMNLHVYTHMALKSR